MASSSSYYTKKSDKAISVLEKMNKKEKKKDRVMRNSFGMMHGLIIADIRANTESLVRAFDLPDIDSVKAATDYLIDQALINEQIQEGIKKVLDTTILKMKRLKDGAEKIKNF